MSTTIIGPTNESFPAQPTPAIVQIQERWGDGWQTVPELEFKGGHCATAGHDLDECELLHRHGAIKEPWEAAYSTHRPASLLGWWVRVLFAGPQGFQPVWIGKIANDARKVFGVKPEPGGEQTLMAYGPANILRRIHVSRSKWKVDGEEVTIGWLAPVNEKYGRGDDKTQNIHVSKSGNRSTEESLDGVTFLHGGKELWTWREYIDYLLKNAVDESADGGPRWRLGGALESLIDCTEHVEWPNVTTVASMLSHLIRPEFGLDWKVIADDDGFVVWVFALSAESFSWGTSKLAGNPDTVRVKTSRNTSNVQTTVVRSADHKYGQIRVIGGRIVVCCTLAFPNRGSNPSWLVGNNGLTYGWLGSLTAAYNNGTGYSSDSADLHDLARAQDKFRDVYRKFGVPYNWDFQHGSAAPQWDGQGKRLDDPAPFQRLVRRTLTHLPLEVDVDYSVWPPVKRNTTETEAAPELVPPLVWFWSDSAAGYVPAHDCGVSVHVLPTWLGVYLHATPNHLIAKNTFVPGFGGVSVSNVTPIYDFRTAVVTLAFESDQRPFYERRIDGATHSDGELVIDASDCQVWYLAPLTAVDVDGSGQLIPSTNAGQPIRDDSPRMTARMRGAVARYTRERARASITVHGLLPWSLLVGQILTVVDDGGEEQTIGAPITQVQWQNGPNPTTTINTGFARGE